MALKRKLTTAEYDALSDALKGEYKQDGDSYVLDVEDDPAFSSLKEEKRRLKEQLDAAQAEKTAREEAERLAREEAAKSKGDVDALEKSWKEKYERDLKTEQDKATAANAALQTAFVDSTAQALAQEISLVPTLMVDLIKRRLRVEIVEGAPITRVVDAAGRPSALSVTDLKKEFVDNPEFAAIIKGSNANGGGANGRDKPGGAQPKKLSEMTATEEAKFANEHPEEYSALIAKR